MSFGEIFFESDKDGYLYDLSSVIALLSLDQTMSV
ncbi:Protein of unknown function [Pyronema omphalodes CBS 100304]|uniref:Uncharacterized protein n=1 Tax=Pyronema omphalodes (strain CBS 100304) TaxID=1076935 RepID=U4LB02_PYROM|nr:Protein of unknown function [Pyronema omphalodes CBS 100304]